jgi:hypothetical protein
MTVLRFIHSAFSLFFCAAWIAGTLGCKAAAETDAESETVAKKAGSTQASLISAKPVEAEPMFTKTNTWSFLEFSESKCANGSPSGILVNAHDDATTLLIYMEGGGACWDEATCYLDPIASNIESGIHGETLSGALNASNEGIFSRVDSNNPFGAAHFVYVPYCTGDAHQGDQTQTYNGRLTHHVGFANMTLFVARIKATFPDVDSVYLSGSSAGGYGASFNWGQVQDAYGETPVHVINDSGAHFTNPWLAESRESAWRQAWGLSGTIPADCTDCLENFDAVVTYYARRHKGSRGTLLSYVSDPVLADYYHIPYEEVDGALLDLLHTRWAPEPNLRIMLVDGWSHVLLTRPETTQDGISVFDFLREMVSGDENWESINVEY